MKTASWIVLCLMSLLLILGSLGSLFVAYFGSPADDVIVPSSSIQDLNTSQEVKTALRGRRGTAAAFGLAYATLLILVVAGPYRQRALWAWWAILISMVTLCCAVLLRIPALGTLGGTGTAGVLLGVTVVGLLLDVKRFKRA